MKIRMGFVSNSSSTSFVIALTRDFVPSEAGISKFIDNTDYDKKMSVDEAKEAIAAMVNTLCEHGSISAYDGDWGIENTSHVSAFIDSFEEDISISEADAGHGCDFLHNILADDIKEKTLDLVIGKEEDEDS